MNAGERAAYFRSQIIANLVINSGLNGIIAYIFYQNREIIKFNEAVVDIQITVAIIAFFVSWIWVSAVRKKLESAKPGQAAWGRWASLRLPDNAVLRSLVIMLALMVLYGGLLLTGPLTQVHAPGFSNWGYILFKTIYTGGCGACAEALAILSVYREYGL